MHVSGKCYLTRWALTITILDKQSETLGKMGLLMGSIVRAIRDLGMGRNFMLTKYVCLTRDMVRLGIGDILWFE
jgi:hypothetical protein